MSERDTGEVIEINLETIGGKIFAGRPRGEAVRLQYNLDQVDRNKGRVNILVPPNAKVLSSSFLLGLVGDSINHWKTKNEFLEHYSFSMPEIFRPSLNACIVDTLRKDSGLISD